MLLPRTNVWLGHTCVVLLEAFSLCLEFALEMLVMLQLLGTSDTQKRSYLDFIPLT